MFVENTQLPWIKNTNPADLPKNIPILAVFKELDIPVMVTINVVEEANIILADDPRGYGLFLDTKDIEMYLPVVVLDKG